MALMKVAVIRFPGTNNEYETIRALRSFDVNCSIVDHKNVSEIGNYDGYWLAGGFSYADVLRAGAIAAKSQIIEEISASEKPTLGICNGFQILTEAKLLPGALLSNSSTRFICKWVHLKITDNTVFTEYYDRILKIPIAHFDGNLYVDTTQETQDFVKYCSPTGDINQQANPNGSQDNIAGLLTGKGQFIGMMPHPERASFTHQGSTDGRVIIQTFLNEVKR